MYRSMLAWIGGQIRRSITRVRVHRKGFSLSSSIFKKKEFATEFPALFGMITTSSSTKHNAASCMWIQIHVRCIVLQQQHLHKPQLFSLLHKTFVKNDKDRSLYSASRRLPWSANCIFISLYSTPDLRC